MVGPAVSCSNGKSPASPWLRGGASGCGRTRLQFSLVLAAFLFLYNGFDAVLNIDLDDATTPQLSRRALPPFGPPSNPTARRESSRDVTGSGRGKLIDQNQGAAASNPNLVEQGQQPPRHVDFYTIKELKGQNGYFYSGMWWQSVENFVKLKPEVIVNAEGSSFKAFKTVGHDAVYMTRDWLDFHVEHLSKWFRHRDLHEHDDDFFDQVVARMAEYVNRTVAERYDPAVTASTAPAKTLAVLPLGSFGESSRRNSELCSLALAATLASLWKIGMPRAVLAGEPDSEIMAEAARDRLAPHFARHPMEVTFVPYNYTGIPNKDRDGTERKKKLHARTAFYQLRQALRDNPMAARAHRTAWLGVRGVNATHHPWTYVYFTEPDHILGTRPEALPALTRQMRNRRPHVNDRHGLLSAHRFQTLVHGADFPDHPQQDEAHTFIPPRDDASDFVVLDGNNPQHACCDAGIGTPALDRHGKCGTGWWKCGIGRGKGTAGMNDTERHVRLRHYYPLVRLRRGLGLPVVDEHARLCIPKTDGSWCADSFAW